MTPPYRAPSASRGASLSRRHVLAWAGATWAAATPALAAASSSAAPAVAEAMDAAEQAHVLEALADELARRFVFPDIGRRYAEMLHDRRREGRYAAMRDPAAFAAAVTADLQAVHPDRHLALRVRQAAAPPGRAATAGAGHPLKAVERAEMIGEVALIQFHAFPDDPAVVRAVRAFLTGPAQAARALVIDARTHRGGSLQVMDALLALIYAEPRTLVRMDTRREAASGGPLDTGPTLREQPAPDSLVRHDHVVVPDRAHRALQSVPVMMLTSSRTASAAEHLALALQSSGRATLVGETTRGAGHFGGMVDFGRFHAFVPVGRTYDPRTGQDWEGRGVRPDVDVPAAQALDKALTMLAARGIKTTV